MVIVKANKDTEAGVMPSQAELAAMGDYNGQLVKAGIMKSGEGLQPSSKGVRIAFGGDSRQVISGPFALSSDSIAGFWLWEVSSMDEAIAWAKRCPNPTGVESVLEIRPVFEADDFGDQFTPELREQEERWRKELGH